MCTVLSFTIFLLVPTPDKIRADLLILDESRDLALNFDFDDDLEGDLKESFETDFDLGDALDFDLRGDFDNFDRDDVLVFLDLT
jgi:hypothetical protein